MPKKVKRLRLPNKIMVLPNPDKTFHEKWYPGRNMLNVPHPSQILCMGPPNTGKGNTIKNITAGGFQKKTCVRL